MPKTNVSFSLSIFFINIIMYIMPFTHANIQSKGKSWVLKKGGSMGVGV